MDKLYSYLLILPVALLVAYSQIVFKSRSTILPEDIGFIKRVYSLLTDPFILSGYAAAFCASIAWIMIVKNLSLSLAYPLYLGTTFILVVFASVLFLNESMSLLRLTAIFFVMIGIVMGAISNLKV